MLFNENFLWGGATSANQIEGGYNKGGRGLSVQDVLPYGIRGERTNKPTSDNLKLEGIDFYSHYKEDIQLFAEMGFKVYRMSISWSRIYPTGEELQPNEEGLQFYDNVIDECLKYGIEPMITILHYDMPLHLSKKYNGWTNRELIKFYERYCRTLFKRYGQKVKYWIPFNEINSVLMIPFMSGGIYNEASEQDKYEAAHHMLLASALVTKIGHQMMPDSMFGAMILSLTIYPLTPNPDDIIQVMEKKREIFMFSDVLARGYYPNYTQRLLKEKDVHLEISESDQKLLRNTCDFISFSYYSCNCMTTDHSLGEQGDANLTSGLLKNPYVKESAWGWAIDPKGLRYTLNLYYDRYQKPLFIAENGLGENDVLIEDNQHQYTVEDDYRIAYMREHILQIGEAIQDGIPVLGYTVWGCIDLISCSTSEMKKRYGMIYVDRYNDGSGTFRRYRKKSFYWYKKVIASNGQDLD